VQHDAHHRGRISPIARALGHEFSGDDIMRVRAWKAMPPSFERRAARRRPPTARRTHQSR
jgi:hypothetical protein